MKHSYCCVRKLIKLLIFSTINLYQRLLFYLIKENGTKPVVAFIAGETAPKGRTMGHAGAIVGGAEDTAEAKKKIMNECGIHVVDSPAEIGKKVFEVLS